jgi:hypothetical protein
LIFGEVKMSKLIQQQRALTVSLAPEEGPGFTRRLVVLIPPLEADLTPMARRVWEIASSTGAQVKFLSLCEDAARESSLRRSLATASAMLKTGSVMAEAELVHGRDWVGAVRSRMQTGDMLVCLAEQRAGLLHRPLSQILASDIPVPITILSGLNPPAEEGSKWYSQVILWGGLVGIIIGFGLLQAGIYQDAGKWATVLVLGSLAVEYWLIWRWNSLF